MTVSVFAPAKINLTLHVTGQRDDGYHLIDSLVAFAPVGDYLTFSDAPVSSLTVEGPEAAGVPTDMDNLVMKVAEIMAPDRGLAMTLEKNIPIAAGLGGGSADAAAAFRGLWNNWDESTLKRMEALTEEQIRAEFQPTFGRVVELGADIAMCIASMKQRAQGIGGKDTPVDFPDVIALLVNPRVAVSTKEVFQALKQKNNSPMEEVLPTFDGPTDFSEWLAQQRNDLEVPALKICPEIGTVLGVLRGLDGCLLARMSGSGATCFALFDAPEASRAAREQVMRDNPEWWVSGGWLGNWVEKSVPVFS